MRPYSSKFASGVSLSSRPATRSVGTKSGGDIRRNSKAMPEAAKAAAAAAIVAAAEAPSSAKSVPVASPAPAASADDIKKAQQRLAKIKARLAAEYHDDIDKRFHKALSSPSVIRRFLEPDILADIDRSGFTLMTVRDILNKVNAVAEKTAAPITVPASSVRPAKAVQPQMSDEIRWVLRDMAMDPERLNISAIKNCRVVIKDFLNFCTQPRKKPNGEEYKTLSLVLALSIAVSLAESPAEREALISAFVDTPLVVPPSAALSGITNTLQNRTGAVRSTPRRHVKGATLATVTTTANAAVAGTPTSAPTAPTTPRAIRQ
jgi:hypothetical protein